MFIIFVHMKFLLIEKNIKIKKSFQKLLDNSYRIYNNSKNEEIVFKTKELLLFREINLQKTKNNHKTFHIILFKLKKSRKLSYCIFKILHLCIF